MDTTISRRPIAALVALVAAITLAVGSTTPPATTLHAASPAPRVIAEAVALAANPLTQVWDVFTGVDTTHPLPAGSNPIAPITEQLLRSVATYGGQLLSGQGHLIPGEIATQMKNLQDTLPTIQGLLADDIAVIPAAAFSAFFLTAMVIGSLPGSASALSGLPEIWLRAVFVPPLKWAYNGFAIRNAIATALQPPTSTPEPAAASATPAAPATPAQRRSSTPRATTATPQTKGSATATSKRSAKPSAAGGSSPRAKSGVAGSQRQRQAAP